MSDYQQNIESGTFMEIFDHEGFKVGFGMFLDQSEEQARWQHEDVMSIEERFEKMIGLMNKYKGQPSAVIGKFWGELEDLIFPLLTQQSRQTKVTGGTPT